MNRESIIKLLNNAHGIGTHEPSSVESKNDFTAYGTCRHCLQKISTSWIEDDDIGGFWSEWRGAKNCLIPPK